MEGERKMLERKEGKNIRKKTNQQNNIAVLPINPIPNSTAINHPDDILNLTFSRMTGSDHLVLAPTF